MLARTIWAVHICTAFFLNAAFLTAHSVASPIEATKRESYSDIIKKAENLMLQRDRLKAVRVLSQGLEKEDKSSAAYKKLTKKRYQLASLFFSNKGQQSYQLGESRYFSKTSGAIEKYLEAASLEPGHLYIQQSLVRAHLREKRCSEAFKIIEQMEKDYFLDEELTYYKIRTLYCLEEESLAEKLNEQNELRLIDFEFYLAMARMPWVFRKAKKEKVLNLAHKWKKRDKLFPEPYYWSWKAKSFLGEDGEEDLQTYLSLCKDLSSKLRRKYKLEPNLCGFRSELDDFVKNRLSK